MDDDQVGELRSWAAGLTTDTRPEVKAAAKAILLLAQDLEAARSQLLEERLIREALEASQPVEDAADGPAPESADGPAPESADGIAEDAADGTPLPDAIHRDLRARLRGYLPSRRSRPA